MVWALEVLSSEPDLCNPVLWFTSMIDWLVTIMWKGFIIRGLLLYLLLRAGIVVVLGSMSATVVPLGDKRMTGLGALSIFWRRYVRYQV